MIGDSLDDTPVPLSPIFTLLAYALTTKYKALMPSSWRCTPPSGYTSDAAFGSLPSVVNLIPAPGVWHVRMT
eukprot:CAMPEP_0173125094 /NCGR_PEP_ID=MMETSP1102-20130122/56156_1 /TAXON_ID=49646 /ORGANISM="Geminigera sp., Strain Caron Lab Isolate" /LENGTH=71 /DNA_ID=CAMNT_0014033785 /DNA_START=58 /DNA_END=273 /DNA_ORIENTATION=+